MTLKNIEAHEAKTMATMTDIQVERYLIGFSRANNKLCVCQRGKMLVVE